MPRFTQLTRSIVLASAAALAPPAVAQPAAPVVAAAEQPAEADGVDQLFRSP
jgi:hypothetical protein